MSGTSMDGVDASIIESDGNRKYATKLDKYFEYGDELQQKLINIRAKIFNAEHLIAYSEEIKDLEKEITLFHANAVNEILANSKIEVDLITGRHHQIRCSFSEIGFPILGDLKYGSQRSNKDSGIYLHSREVYFTHPVSKEEINIKAEPPRYGLWSVSPSDL